MPCAVLRGPFTLQFLAYGKDILSLSFLYQEDWNSLFLAISVVDRSIVVEFTSEMSPYICPVWTGYIFFSFPLAP